MRTRLPLIAAVLTLALSGAAQAATGWTLGDLNLRTGPGTGYAKITTMPAGARVEIIRCTSWCELYFAGYRGWASASYITTARAAPAPRYVRPPMPPSVYWYYGRPRWDDRYRSWYDGRRWWYDNRWHPRPRTGIYFEFGR